MIASLLIALKTRDTLNSLKKNSAADFLVWRMSCSENR